MIRNLFMIEYYVFQKGDILLLIDNAPFTTIGIKLQSFVPRMVILLY